MKVILLKNVGGVGQQGSVKDISDGYAQNFLIPNGLAVQATTEKIKEHDEVIRNEKKSRAEKDAALAKAIQALEGAKLEIKARATAKGGLFKAITAADIARTIKEQKGADVEAGTIGLEKPIKQTGEHPIRIKSGTAAASLTIDIQPAS